MSQSQPIAPRDAAALVLIAVIWAVNTVLTKYALVHLPPFLASSIRFAITAVVLVTFMPPKQGALPWLAMIGLLTALHFGIQSVGLWLAHDLAPMVIAMQLWIPASAIMASVFLRERMGARRMAGVAISFLGIVVLAAEPTLAPQLFAFGLVGIASILYGGVSVVVRRGPAVHPLAYQAWIALAALATFVPISAVSESNHVALVQQAGWGPIAALAFAAFASSVVANAMMFSLVRKYEVARTTPYMFLTPVLAVAFGVMFLGDPITAQFLAGCAITLAGVFVTALAERQLSRPAE